MDDIKILKNTVQIKKRKMLIVFDDMITDMLDNKKLNWIVTELFIRGRTQNISFVFVTQSYFAAPKNVRITLCTTLLWKFQTNEKFKKIHLIIDQNWL